MLYEKKLWIFLGIVFCVLISLKSINVRAENSLTLDQVISWLNNEIKTQAKRGSGQCVDFCNYYLSNCWGRSTIGGNAKDWVGKVYGWNEIPLNGSFDNCQIGDLLVEVYKPDGHVSVYYGKENGKHWVVDQNNQGVKTTGKHRLWADFSNPIHCYRPNYSDSRNFEIDLNWTLDGANVVDATDFATADVYINGQLVAANATDYWGSWPVGTTWEIKNVKVKPGYQYLGLIAGKQSGTLGTSHVECRFGFKTEAQYNISLSWKLDGVDKADSKDFASADVYINGKCVASGVTKYFGTWPNGTEYEIKNIKANKGYTFEYVVSGKTSGTLLSESVECKLYFSKVIVEINYDSFPSGLFNGYISSNYDKNKDGILSEYDIKDVTYMNITSACGNPSGFEYFKNLERLYVTGINNFEKLDVSKNTKLTILGCYKNKDLYSLDIGKNTNLTTLYCYDNRLTSLDVSQITNLEILECQNNELHSLDVRNNKKLQILNCKNNLLSRIYLQDNTNISSLDCGDNSLIELNLSKNINLRTVNCKNSPKTRVIICNNDNLVKSFKNGGSIVINGVAYTLDIDDTAEIISEYVPITIVKQPVSIKFKRPKTSGIVMYTVEATGTALKYQWQYKSVSESDWNSRATDIGGNRSDLFYGYSNESPNMCFRCIISDIIGEQVVSEVVYLTLIDNPEIIKQPESVTVEAGSLSFFGVEAKGDDLKYLWQYKNVGESDWIDWTSKTTSYISVAYAAFRDGMSLRCVITDSLGNKIISDEVTLTYKSSLKITTQPENTTVGENELAYFTVKASGNGLKYMWQYQEKGKSTWTDWTSKTTAAISVAYASYRNGMNFRCVVTDSTGTKVTSNAATLTYKSNLKITTQPENTTVNENEIAYFNVKASGNGLKFLWQYQEKGKSTWTDWNTKTTAAISVAYASYRNGMSFRCIVTDSTGTKVTSNAATLTYKSASTLSITKQPANTSVNEGELAYFEVAAKGKGLKYLWQYQEKGKSTWTDWTTKTTAKISVAYASYRNGMKFRCVVTDSTGNKVISNAATLTYKVNNTLTITKQPVNTSVNANELAYFSVAATGRGLTYKWQCKNVGESSWTTWSSKTTASISVAYLASRNGMSLRCIVTDADGNTEVSDVAKLSYK